MRKDENKFIKNAVLLGLGLLGLKYILPKIIFAPAINIDVPEPIIDYALPDKEIIDTLDDDNNSGSGGGSGNGNSDDGKTYPEDSDPDIIIDYAAPPIDDNPNPSDDGKTNPVDHIIDYSPPIDDIDPPYPGSSTYSTKDSPRLDPDPYKPPSGDNTYPIRKETLPIASKTTVISAMKGVFFDMINEMMLGDRTWFYSQQDVIDMEKIKTYRNSANNHCCDFVENNEVAERQHYKEIFY